MIDKLEAEITAAIAAAADAQSLDAVRVAALGKSGSISELLKSLGGMSPDDRKVQGPLINGLRDRVQAALVARKADLDSAELNARLNAERVDLSLPAPPRRKGSVHPTMQVMDEMIAVFAEMGFAVAEGPDIETDFNNFTALNFPLKHPAREMHDTFFLPEDAHGERKVLRNCGLDPDVWQGFAFGCGVDRLGVLKYGMPDLRDMFASDVRWLAHYGFSANAAPNPATGLS